MSFHRKHLLYRVLLSAGIFVLRLQTAGAVGNRTHLRYSIFVLWRRQVITFTFLFNANLTEITAAETLRKTGLIPPISCELMNLPFLLSLHTTRNNPRIHRDQPQSSIEAILNRGPTNAEVVCLGRAISPASQVDTGRL